MHPALVAQAAATVAEMMPGRFFLGLGTGENLNEHITGERWPSASERREMLGEAVEVIRALWTGDLVDHEGKHFRVVDARLYTLPRELPPIYVAAGGPKAAGSAARIGDGVIATAPDAELVESYEDAGGRGPRLGQLTVCWAADEASARKTALEWWPNAALRGELGQELPLPRHFEQAAEGVTEEQIAESVVCGPDAERHVRAIREYEDAGFDEVFVHQVGPDQEGGLRFYAEEVLPRLRTRAARRAG
jgi:G6PDH family F420-dependent oxidoreductase